MRSKDRKNEMFRIFTPLISLFMTEVEGGGGGGARGSSAVERATPDRLGRCLYNVTG